MLRGGTPAGDLATLSTDAGGSGRTPAGDANPPEEALRSVERDKPVSLAGIGSRWVIRHRQILLRHAHPVDAAHSRPLLPAAGSPSSPSMNGHSRRPPGPDAGAPSRSPAPHQEPKPQHRPPDSTEPAPFSSQIPAVTPTPTKMTQHSSRKSTRRVAQMQMHTAARCPPIAHRNPHCLAQPNPPPPTPLCGYPSSHPRAQTLGGTGEIGTDSAMGQRCKVPGQEAGNRRVLRCQSVSWDDAGDGREAG